MKHQNPCFANCIDNIHRKSLYTRTETGGALTRSECHFKVAFVCTLLDGTMSLRGMTQMGTRHLLFSVFDMVVQKNYSFVTLQNTLISQTKLLSPKISLTKD